MIIVNGSIAFVVNDNISGLDADGYPITPQEKEYKRVNCQYIINKYDNLGRSNDEHFTVASYVILIEEMDVPSEVIRLYDDDEKLLGQFAIISVEELQAVCQLKILV